MNLLRFDSETAWVSGTALFWRERLRLNPRLCHCLASGHTPNAVFAEMVRAVKEGLVSFKQASVFALDEFGGLTPEDAGRCSNMLRHHLIGHIDLPAEAFVAPNPEAASLEEECRGFEAAVGKGFDLVLLGVGLNGHLGMNEPGSAPESGVRRVELHETTVNASARYVSHAQLPRWGITVGLKQILAAKEVWLLAKGAAKADIIQRTVKGEIDPNVPASLLRRHPNAWLFLDGEAGRLL